MASLRASGACGQGQVPLPIILQRLTRFEALQTTSPRTSLRQAVRRAPNIQLVL
jgi:hypothetical protein